MTESMQTAEVTPQPQFEGSDDERRIADEAFQALRVMGRFFPRTAPIRAPLDSLAAFFASRHPERSAEEWRSVLERALAANTAVFARQDIDGQVMVVTTLSGQAPTLEPQVDLTHTLARRFEEPVPVPERAAEPRPRPRRPAAEELIPTEEAPPGVEVEVEVFEPVPGQVVEAIAEEPSVEVEVAAAEAELASDITGMDDAELADVIATELRRDVTVANFGDLWMVEDKVPRLSRGDLRRIREYLLERNEPLIDDELLQDVLGVRLTSDEYELHRFTLNYRLSREHREFEFVGTPQRRLWSTNGLPPIGTSKRKPSEIGQDYRFLLEYPAEEAAQGEGVVEHVLTFYEYQLGVLPFDATFQSLFPAPVLPDQRAAVLAMESPQTYETFFVELRYPTGNRGGYIAGFESFFQENLVPGALITIERGETDGQYLLEYLPISGQDRKLLQLDEKKGRYVFRPTTFYCATQDNMLLTDNRFPRLANAAPLEDRIRRRPEDTLAATFERIGEREGPAGAPRYMAMLDDLVAVANVDRPMSADLIRDIVQSPQNLQFSVDPDVEDVFYYQPNPEQP